MGPPSRGCWVKPQSWSYLPKNVPPYACIWKISTQKIETSQMYEQKEQFRFQKPHSSPTSPSVCWCVLVRGALKAILVVSCYWDAWVVFFFVLWLRSKYIEWDVLKKQLQYVESCGSYGWALPLGWEVVGSNPSQDSCVWKGQELLQVVWKGEAWGGNIREEQRGLCRLKRVCWHF